MLINLKVKTLDAQTHDFSIDNEITVREFKDKIAEKTNIAADQQRIIYCGRVLADEKHIKDYDVDGKVVHVAERPPPSQRAASSSSSNSNEGNPIRERPTPRISMRNSPLFRALDGMVVGTMAIPMNANMHNNGQMAGNPFSTSSTFCMNRITVARHMLECANNIAAYLENPERGLNNTSLDILTRGRWTMESTVVEVGITASDMPQNQNIVEMVQGAVSAALRHNGNTNVTVVQLPTVFSSNENESAADGNNELTTNNSENAITGAESASAAVIIEDVMDSEEEGATNASNVAQAGSIASNSNSNSSTGTATAAASLMSNIGEGNNTSTSTGTNTEETAQRRTGTRVLAEVIQQMRTVQTRLSPFIQQFYELLENEPTFQENDTTGRENMQRIFDRVSEALHYMSHAQHAISDLMLDVSQPAPRYLTCRPIMVEQSGYISSNNYLSAAAAAAAAVRQHQQQPAAAQAVATAAASNASDRSTPSTTTATRSTPTTLSTRPETSSNGNITGVEDPTDDPIYVPFIPPFRANAANAGASNNENHQMQMARLIQAVVNSAPIDTEFHVQINAPSIVSIGVPLNANATDTHNANARTPIGGGTSNNENMQRNATPAATTTTNAPVSNTNSSSIAANTGMPQTRSNTATLPTTSTQTRSTSRPQLQIGNIPAAGWNGRFIPTNMVSSFDRFLPCNSHHINETDNANNQHANTAAAAAATGGATSAGAATGTAAGAGAGATGPNMRNRPSAYNNIATTLSALVPHSVAHMTPTTSNRSAASSAGNDSYTYRRNLRSQLWNFITEHIFDGEPVNENTIPPAIGRATQWFNDSLIYLPQYEKPECDSRHSVLNILRRTLPHFIEIFNDNEENLVRFELRLKQICEQFVKRLYSVLYVCVGRANVEMYWPQLMRLLLLSVRSKFRDEAFQFLCVYLNPDVTSLDIDTSDAEQFITHRDDVEQAEASPVNMEVEVDNSGVEHTSDGDNEGIAAAQLPTVVTGSEPWHRSFPNEWLPIITRDIQTQSETNLKQGPFSDAYISGMSAKRKKFMQSCKPSADMRSLIADNVRRAIQTVGVTASTASNQSQTIDEITNAIANDSVAQTSYTEAVRSSARDRTLKDPNYKPEKFPFTTKFVNK